MSKGKGSLRTRSLRNVKVAETEGRLVFVFLEVKYFVPTVGLPICYGSVRAVTGGEDSLKRLINPRVRSFLDFPIEKPGKVKKRVFNRPDASQV